MKKFFIISLVLLLVFYKNIMPAYKPLFSPQPTPYLSPSQGGNKYVPQGTVSYPVSQNATPIPMTPIQGGTNWANNTYGYNNTPYTAKPVNYSSTPNPTPVPTPTQPSGFDVNSAQGANVGDQRNGMRWTGKVWEPLGGSGGGGVPDPSQQVRNDINSGYDAYFSSLDQMMGNIPGQQKGQEQTVQNNFNQNISDLGSQQQQSMADLATSRRKSGEQQVKSLQDISENIRNLFQTGNVMLGTRGAGDSSAANQYSYAVTKLGSKERGNVMSQSRAIESDIADREARLNDIVTQETGKYKTERDNKIIEVAQWFQDQQNQLIQAKASGQLQKGQSLAQLSTQLLQNAQNELIRQDTNYKNRQNALLSWATSNATNINQLKTNLAAIGQYNVPANQAQDISGQPTFDAQGNMTTSFGGGGGYREPTKDKLPQNFSQFGGMLTSQLPLGNTLDNLIR